MLKMISWMQWWVGAGMLTGLYYGAVLVGYYKTEWIKLFKGVTGVRSAGAEGVDASKEKPELYIATEKALQALVACVGEGSEGGSTKDEVKAKIRSILVKYAYLKDTPYAIVIDHLLLRETNQSVRLNEEEVRSLWR